MTTADEYRAMSDQCFQLAQHALTKQERIRHCRMALVWLLAVTCEDHAIPALPPAPRLSRIRSAEPNEIGHGHHVVDSAKLPDEEGRLILGKVLEALSDGSAITFSADQLGEHHADCQRALVSPVGICARKAVLA
jgi:hypothetical protein